MSGIFALGPYQQDDPSAPHGKALKPKFAIVFALIFHRDHRGVECALIICDSDERAPAEQRSIREHRDQVARCWDEAVNLYYQAFQKRHPETAA